MLDIKSMGFSYNSPKKLFENFNLNIPAGNVYGLLGENGAGKTTLLKIICGISKPDAGECRVYNCLSYKLPAQMLANIYFLPEEFHVPAIKIKFYADLYGRLYPRFSQKKFVSYVEELGVDIESKFTNVSYGQKKKGMLAFALATNCRLMMLDEPTNGFDITSKNIFRKLLAQEAASGMTFLISTHQIKDVEQLINYILILHKGKLIISNSLAELSEKFAFYYNQYQVTEGALYSTQAVNDYDFMKKTEDITEDRLIDIEKLFMSAILKSDNVKY